MSFCSATKYFSGHSDAMGGSLAVNKKVFKKIMFFYKLSGYRMSADEAYLIIRGLRTLDTRLKQHSENTKAIIAFLKRQKKKTTKINRKLTTKKVITVPMKKMNLMFHLLKWKRKLNQKLSIS